MAVTFRHVAIEAVMGVGLIGLCQADSFGRQHQHNALNTIKDSFELWESQQAACKETIWPFLPCGTKEVFQ